MTTDHLEPGCFACDQQAAGELPPREDISRTEHWRVAHAFNSTLPGWLVLVPVRYLTSFAHLTSEEADGMGGLVRRLGIALEAVTGCTKTYLMQFSEAEGFSHLHVHLVPRMVDQPDEVRGPGVFAYLSSDRTTWIPSRELDAIALAVRKALP